MYKLCVFAGTTEGRALASFLTEQPEISVTACAATEYGGTLMEPAQNLTVLTGRMDKAEMAAFFRENGFALVLDATHPYAQVVTQNLCEACAETGTPYLRVQRGASEQDAEAVYVPDIAAAAAYLRETEGNILLTTGSKELGIFTAAADFGDRVYARVLPMDASLESCRAAGVKPARILAMQGPFTEEMNLAMLRFTNARYLVTKDGGTTGGFAEKLAAARTAGVRCVVIGRPPMQSGSTYAEAVQLLCSRFGCRVTPQVQIVGIGTGSLDGMTGEVRRAIEHADCVIGAKRMLACAKGKPGFCAIAPEAISEIIHSHPEYRRFTVIMSGDTGFFSGTKNLLPLLHDCKTAVLPGISSLSCLCARLGTSYEDVRIVSLHGRQHDITNLLHSEKRIFALVGGSRGINELCETAVNAGLGQIRVCVGQRLGYPDECITCGTAAELVSGSFDPLSVALLENDTPDAPVTHGLPDEAFQRRQSSEATVPMTKSEVRSISLSKLALTKHAVCWDVGAGTGSVAIEMALQLPSGAVYAIERKADALDLLAENKARFHVGNMTVVPGIAPDACRDLPAPTHVFIGGSSGNMHDILRLILEKNPRARIVATAIALETVAELQACMHDFPWQSAEAVCVQAARSRKAGPYHLMTGNNPVYIFTLQGGA